MTDHDTILAPVEMLDTPALADQYDYLVSQLDELTGYELRRLADIEVELRIRVATA